MSDEDAYFVPALPVGIVSFLGCWAYAIAEYGWFLGLGVGWIPAFFIGVMAGLLWPLLVLAALGLALLFFA